MMDGTHRDIAIPTLPSLQIDETFAFYGAIGFAKESDYGEYGIVRRDTMEIHFWKCDDRAICEASGCYIRVADVDALFADIAPKVAPPGRVSETVEDQPWGMREFYVWDPHGNLLRIGQEIGGQ